MNKLPLIKVRGLKKSFQKKNEVIDILMGIDLDIYSGDKIVITGASGVGKSTFLHILGTLERPSSGEILYKNTNVFHFSSESLAHFRNRKIGFVFQFHYLLAEFNALENVMLPALIAGWPKKKARLRAEELLLEVGLKDRFYHQIGELSGGERQRVSIARALILEPEIVLADEPTGSLDENTAATIRELIFSLQKKKQMTLIVATHNLNLASFFPLWYELSHGKLHKVERAEEGK